MMREPTAATVVATVTQPAMPKANWPTSMGSSPAARSAYGVTSSGSGASAAMLIQMVRRVVLGTAMARVMTVWTEARSASVRPLVGPRPISSPSGTKAPPITPKNKQASVTLAASIHSSVGTLRARPRAMTQTAPVVSVASR